MKLFTRMVGVGGFLFIALTTMGCPDWSNPDKWFKHLEVEHAGELRVGKTVELWVTYDKYRIPENGQIEIKDKVYTVDSITWTSSKDGHLGNGPSIKASGLSPGKHEITVEASLDGEWRSAKTTIEIKNTPPQAAIDRSATTARFGVLESGVLVGSATDPDFVEGPEEIPDARLEWHSNKDGFLGKGRRFEVSGLSGGKHQIELRAKDEFGAVGKSTIEVEVTNELPTVTILEPTANRFFNVRDPIALEATASDPEDAQLNKPIPDERIVWTSDRDGEIGKGLETMAKRLTPGKHKITCSATDSHKGVGKATVEILVNNELPSARIRFPFSGDDFEFDDEILLGAEAQDEEDGEIRRDGSFVWTLKDGTHLGIGRSTTLPAGSLPPGQHEVVLVVTDSDGGESQPKTVRVEVEAPGDPRINAPLAGISVYTGQRIQLSGYAPAAPLSFVWEASAAGRTQKLYEGKTVGNPQRTEHSTGLHVAGDYTITLRAVYNHGYVKETSVRITVVEPGPGVEVVDPIDPPLAAQSLDVTDGPTPANTIGALGSLERSTQ